jgi:hypothetical protein
MAVDVTARGKVNKKVRWVGGKKFDRRWKEENGSKGAGDGPLSNLCYPSAIVGVQIPQLSALHNTLRLYPHRLGQYGV